ncbi:MAG: dihydroxyacetone kinase subunit DhaK, partial [Eubacteriales bacterium]|nr:dihydroxyacetone kinase subunit DhaK [Eubacteriales bacterium]
MKKILNRPDEYTTDMLKGIYAVHSKQIKYAGNDLHCYCRSEKTPGKVAIITGGGNGHLPLFLGYVGDGLLDGCGVGDVFQSPSAKQIHTIVRETEAGAGVLFLYGNYTGDVMVFDDAAERCDMDGIETRSLTGSDDVNSSPNPDSRRGVAGIFFLYKAAGAKARAMGTLDEVLAAAQKAKAATR